MIYQTKFYFAPLEGLTGYVYRNAHRAFFGETVEKYYSPFIVANRNRTFKSKEINDILPDNNRGINLVPQLLTNNAEDFLCTAKKIEQMGYREVNLNLGCPSGTVVSKFRGSGFLSLKDELHAFLEDIYRDSPIKISIKTRIGKDRPEEFYELIEIFNQYPIAQLTIHPRIQKDYYRNKPNLAVFRDAVTLSKNPVCYNGDLFTVQDYSAFAAAFPTVQAVMIGRGLLTNPGLVNEILFRTKLEKPVLRAFHDQIFEDYKKILSGEANVLYKMKELWFYLIRNFPDHAKHAKRLKKAEHFGEYEDAVASIFRERDIAELSVVEFP
jgi:tRNA-dihydrouridine synthase